MLSKVHRFHGLHALDFAHRKGRVIRATSMSLKYTYNSRSSDYRVAVVVSKKVSKSAVVRNRIRRRVYEAVRTHADRIHEPYDLIFMIYSPDIATMPSEQLHSIVNSQLTKAGMV